MAKVAAARIAGNALRNSDNALSRQEVTVAYSFKAVLARQQEAVDFAAPPWSLQGAEMQCHLRAVLR
jgi:hypothetical protein